VTVLKIPMAANIVVGLIRKRIPRPRHLPQLWRSPHGGKFLRWWRKGNSLCPLGLLNGSPVENPCTATQLASAERDELYDRYGFKKLDKAVEAFAEWWDKQRDPKTAVDAVWPEGTIGKTP
jgi:phosphoketolase